MELLTRMRSLEDTMDIVVVIACEGGGYGECMGTRQDTTQNYAKV